MADVNISDSNQFPGLVLNLNQNNFVKFGGRSFVGHHEDKFSAASLAEKVKNSGVRFAVEVVETFVQKEKGAPHNVIHSKDKGQVASLPLAAAKLVEA